MKRMLCAVMVLLGLTSAAGAQATGAPLADVKPPKVESAAERDARMGWWRQARFGMFIHWGVYSVPAGDWNGKRCGGPSEWIMQSLKIPVSQYLTFADSFNPVKYDPKAWAKAARQAGVQYVVITSRHHDGFCLWDSATSDWDVMRTPYKQDLLRPLAEACRAEGIRFCLYYSILDWRHPDYLPRRAWNDLVKADGDFDGRFVPYVHAQVEEIIRAYQPSVLWFDGEWEDSWTVRHGRELERHVRSLKPDIIVNNRVGKSRDDMAGLNKAGVESAGDFCTPEQEVPSTGLPGVDWESCMTMNDSWGFKRSDEHWKSSRTLIRTLVDIASKGGNFLLNVGPTAEGEIPAPSLERLAAMGQWLKVNGEAIYGTHAGPFRKLAWGRCTAKGQTLYLHVFDWPSDGLLRVPGLKNKVKSARVLGGGLRETAWNADERGVAVSLGGSAPDADASVVALEIEGAPVVEDVPIGPRPDGAIVLAAEEAELHGGSLKVERHEGKSNIGFWTSQAGKAEWLIRVPVDGRYAVELELACIDGEEGDRFVVDVGGQTIGDAVPATGAWQKYTTVSAGRVTLKAGVQKLTVGAAPGLKGALMNLREVRIVQADKSW